MTSVERKQIDNDEWDDVTGGWFQNKVYQVDLDNSTRNYVQEVVMSNQYKLNGRTFYFVEDRKETFDTDEIPAPILVSEPKWKTYPFKAMYLLICTGFRVPEIMQFFTHGKNCSNFGSKIASSLIKIASTRIFAEPEQSILELPVNSIDSYSKTRSSQGSVGKFGMGFFSILYWLVGHPLRFIKITSYNNNDLIICIIQEIEGELRFQLQFRKSNVTVTGSCMELNCELDPFDEMNVTKFQYQLEKLSYTTTDLIAVRSDPAGSFTRMNSSSIQTPTKVYVQYNQRGIVVEDFAQGISLLVLLKTLFVPSVSTKTLKTTLQRTSLQYYLATKQTQIKSETSNKFVILVRSVAVVYLNFHTHSSNKYHIIIELPSSTRIPVSRDDIIFDEETKTTFMHELQIVLAAFVKQKHVYALQSAFEAYRVYTSQVENRQFFVQAEQSFANIPGKIFVYYKYYSLLSMLDDDCSNCMLEAQASDLVRLEEYLSQKTNLYNPAIYFLKKVVITTLYLDKNVYVTNAELPNFLFVSKKYTQLQDKWIVTLPQIYLSDKLYLYDSQYANAEVQVTFSTFIEQFYTNLRIPVKFKAKALNLCNQIILQFLKMLQRFEFDEFPVGYHQKDVLGNSFSSPGSGRTKHMLSSLLLLMALSPESGLLYMLKFYATLDLLLNEKITFNYTGATKQMLYYKIGFDLGNPLVINFETVRQVALNKLYVKYITEWAHYTITFNVKHTSQFVLAMWTFWNPFFTYVDSESPQNDSERILFIRLKKHLLTKNLDFKLYMALMFILEYLRQKIYNRLFPHFFEQSSEKLIQFLIEFVEYSIKNLDLFFSHIFLNVWKFITFDKDIEEKLKIAVEVKANEIKKSSLMILPLNPRHVPVFQRDLEVYRFTESQLIEYVLKHNVENEEVFAAVSESKTEVGLNVQITEIAINEGSTKSFVHATVTETVQNSLDAIREFNPENKSISLKLLTSETHIVYQITDYVGVPFKGIISMMIPFLSSKTPSEIVTGEMGSGFFNLYRESDKVVINTVLNGNHTLIIDIPIRDRNNRVIDITRQVQTRRDVNLPNQTDIFVFVPRALDTVFQITSFVYFITNVFGLLNLPRVTFNNQSISIQTESFLETSDFSSRKVVQGKVESYLFTKEVPFFTLSQYLSNANLIPSYLIYHITFNLVINIKHGVYTPVQTRAKINLPPENAAKLSKFLLSNVYLLIVDYLTKERNDEKCNMYLRYFSSHSDLAQLLPLNAPYKDFSELTTIDDFMLHYKLPENNDESFMTLMIKSRTLLGKDSYSTTTLNIRESIKNLSVIPEVASVLTKWLVKKSPPPSRPALENKKTIQVFKKTRRQYFDALKELTHIINVFTQQFWAIGKEVKVYNLLNKAPTVEFQDLEDQFLKGYYARNTHSIVLDFSVFSEQEVIAFNDFFVRSTETTTEGLISKNSVFVNLIENELMTRTLIHELEHARRQEVCENGGHGKVKKVFETDVGKLYEFNQSANAMYTAILANQLFARVFAELRQ